MKIAITGPHFWPYRRRGSAAYIYNLSKHLAEAGHSVEVITGKPGKSRVVNNGFVKISYLRYLINPLFSSLNIDRVHMFTANCLYHFLKNSYDVIHCMYHPDGFTLSHLRKIKKIKYVQLVSTVPFEFHWKHSPIDPYMFGKAIKGADMCIVPSLYAFNYMNKNNNLKCERIPCGVDMRHFRPRTRKNKKVPRILCTAALHDERKNIPLLLKAFEMLLNNGTPAVLQLAAETTPDTNRYLRSLVSQDVLKSVQILPAVTYKELPGYYSAASVSVLSSVSETFGMTVIESLASGTPVVGTNSGALPETISDPSIGNLFDISSDSEESINNLYQAIKRSLELAQDPHTVERCRENASQYDWEKIIKQMEALYLKVLNLQ
jgi:phosphatidylinositol alpha-mannosyltransferase